ncbi:MAG: TRAP transporter small permease [Deltaproteobacteria bacterium]|nr:TRAP transporter small permease [Deltaproteobacteria bacterium]
MPEPNDDKSSSEKRPTRRSGKILRAADLVEDITLVTLLTSMILIAAAQILLRNFFDMGLVWGEQALRVLVLWLGLVGAIAGSRENKHINMDILLRIFPEPAKAVSRGVVGMFTVAVCALLSFHAARFVYLDYETGITAFGNIPVWILELILPIGFGIITLRYAFFSLRQLGGLMTKENGS